MTLDEISVISDRSCSAKHGGDRPEVLQDSLLARLGQMVSNLFAPRLEAPATGARGDGHAARGTSAHESGRSPNDRLSKFGAVSNVSPDSPQSVLESLVVDAVVS